MVRILAISGSLRRASANSGLLRCAQVHAAAMQDVEMVMADIGDPLYNQDLDGEDSPQAVKDFKQSVSEAHAVLFACPEYNYGMTAALKNALDWASKHPSNLWKGKAAAIMGAGGGSGTARAQLSLRQCGAFLDLTFVNAPEVAIQRFREKCFDEHGDLVSETWSERVREMVERLLRLEALLHPSTTLASEDAEVGAPSAKRARAT
jgi:chromate reductase